MIEVAGVVMLQGEFVYLSRRIDPDKELYGHWTDAGGKLEPGESPTQAAAREVMEETASRVEETELHPLGVFHVSTPNARLVVVHAFYVELAPGQVPLVPWRERANLGPWTRYTLEQALALQLVPGTRRALEQLVADMWGNARG